MKPAESMSDPRFLLGLIVYLSAVKSQVIEIDGGGSLTCRWKTSNNGGHYMGCEGIPYAKAPIEGLRFEPPKMYTDWPSDGINLLAQKVGYVCMQFDEAVDRVRGGEDCLYLNIYLPDPIHDLENLPVLFFIHGIDFQTGSGGIHRPKFLLDKEVVLVTFNYRLGAFGFLSTEDDVVPGNMGLKDQVVALRWVKRHIKHFGGDPNNIVIVGQGAGGASVHYHYLSKQTEGLFSKGLSMSGTALDPWALTEKPLETAKRLAAIAGCRTNKVGLMIHCLKLLPAQYIVESSLKLRTFLNAPFAPFGPVIEKGTSIDPPLDPFIFIDKSPIDVILSGQAHDLPWITGVVEDEGLAIMGGIAGNETELHKMNKEWNSIAPVLLNLNSSLPPWKQLVVGKWAKERYLGKRPFASWTLIETVQMVGNRLFVNGGVQAALLHAKTYKSPFRFYKFSYRGLHSFSELWGRNTKNFGVSHRDDLAYVFDLSINFSSREKDRAVRQMWIDFWTSYASKADSSPDLNVVWPTIARNLYDAEYLQIYGQHETTIENLRILGDREFWESLGIQEDALLKNPQKPVLESQENFYYENHLTPCQRNLVVHTFH